MYTIFQLFVSIGFFSLVCAFTSPATTFSQRSVVKDVSTLFAAVDTKGLTLYPVISRLAGKNWTGSCKYVGADLIHLSKLKLSGGLRYDITGRNVTLSSYLTFPNGNTREVVMTGSRDSDSSSHVITLNPIEEGPIKMLLTEIGSDTIIINEVEVATGKTILTASTSITQGRKGQELVQVSHEVGEGIEGHQVWRLTENAYGPLTEGEGDAAREALGAQQKEEWAKKESGLNFNDFDDFRSATGQ